jgi:glycosyltransferase involved in cell wall biosynthesis
MPVHNGVAWIGEAIQSVLMQTEKDIELIIVDDGSTDGTKEFLDDWASQFPNIKIIHNEKNLGAGASRNLGTEAASADIIAITDADDLNTTERAALILKHFELNPESELVTFPYMSVGYCNEELERFDGEPFNHELYLEKGVSNFYCNPSAAVKKASLQAVGGFGHEKCEGMDRKTDDSIFLDKWVKSGRKVDYQAGAYVVGHRNLPNSMMTKIRGWEPKWASKQ